MNQLRTLRTIRAAGRGCAHRSGARWPALASALILLLPSPAAAEDEKGRWTFSLGGGFLSTRDDIRSNAAVVGLQDVGRPDDISDDIIVSGSTDLRQDDLLGRETEAEEGQTYNFAVAYGLTSWLSVQIDLGYYEGNVSNFDTFQISRRYTDVDGDNLIDTNRETFQTPFHDASVPMSAGELRQIPLTFSALFRFRKDSPFNPILGAGVGWVFADLRESQALADLNAEILQGFQRTQFFGTASNTQIVRDAAGNAIVTSTCAAPANRLTNGAYACTKGIAELDRIIQELRDLAAADPDNAELYRIIEEEKRAEFSPLINADFIPTRPMVTAEVEDGFAYQFTGGAEYHFNQNWSVYMLGRYLATKASIRIRITDGGNLFTAKPTDPGIEQVQPVKFELKEALFEFNAEGNIEAQEGVTQDLPPLNDQIYVQGGEINLSSFSLLFGLRYTF
jgi:opacity protein-like surface antigen